MTEPSTTKPERKSNQILHGDGRGRGKGDVVLVLLLHGFPAQCLLSELVSTLH